MEEELVTILENLDKEEFHKMKWFLKKQERNGEPPLTVKQLESASTWEVVDLMIQKFGETGAAEVSMIVLKKMSRNDLWKLVKTAMVKCSDPVPGAAGTPQSEEVFNDKLISIRSQFVDRVSEPVLHKILDKLLEFNVVSDLELESTVRASRAEKARTVIDMVRKKGSGAQMVLITALSAADPCLSRELKLM